MTDVAALLDKADRSLTSARLLLKEGDTDGEANRLYYALRNAAGSALLHRRVGIPKTHAGLITLFSEHLVSTGLIAPAFGRLLNRVEHRRLIADYTAESVEAERLEQYLVEAEAFLAAVRVLVSAGAD